jgi:hypothetical protein
MRKSISAYSQPAAPAAARKIVRRGHSSFVGLFAYDKSEHAIAFESIYELEYLYLLETDADVVAVRSQPETLHWDDDGIRRRHVPDFCVFRTDRIELVEVKPDAIDDEAEASDEEELLQRRTEILKTQLAKEGRIYTLVRETEIRREPRLGNAKILMNGLGQAPSPALRADVLAMMANGPAPIADLVAAVGKGPHFVNAVYALVLAGDLELVDPDAPLTWQSAIQRRRATQWG